MRTDRSVCIASECGLTGRSISPQVDLQLLDAPPANKQVEVFGELQIVDGRPCILAKVRRRHTGIQLVMRMGTFRVDKEDHARDLTYI